MREPEPTLSEVSESAIREIVGRSTLDDVLVGTTRPEITRRTKELIQHTLDYYNSGITVTTVNLEDVQVPDAVIPSQRDANKAQADKERFIKEAQAYANGIMPVAQGAAARMQQDAQAYKAQVSGARRRPGGALRAAAGGLRAGAGGDAPAPVHGHARERAGALPQGADRFGTAGSNMIYLPIDKLLEKSVAREAEQAAEPAARNGSRRSRTR